jgi:hypothetical protein
MTVASAIADVAMTVTRGPPCAPRRARRTMIYTTLPHLIAAQEKTMHTYSDIEREDDEYALPDLELFELTAHEVARMDEDAVYEFSKRDEFRLCHMNGRVQDAMLDAMVKELGITGGWFYWYCFPGCLPDSEAVGPFKTHKAALAAAREE